MKKIIFSLSFLMLCAGPAVAFAQTGTQIQNPDVPRTGVQNNNPIPTATAKLENPLKGVNSLGDLFYKLIDALISIAYVVIAFFLLLSGFKFVTAQGSDDKLSEAKQTFYNTIIGAVLIIGAKTIVEIVRTLINSLNS